MRSTLASSTSNYTGPTNINAGALDYASTAAMPATSTVNVASGGALAVAIGARNPFIFGGSGPGSTNGLLAGTGAQGNTITWAASGAMLGIDTTNIAGGSLAVNGYSSGSVGLAKLGSGTMVMSGTNTYNGPTKLFAGTLDINGPYAFGTGTLMLAGGVIDNTSGGTLTLGNVPQVWSNSFTFGGSNYLNLGNGPVTVSNSLTATVSGSTLEVDGNINCGGNTMTLNTAGSGVLLLAGSVGNIGGGNNEFGNVTITGTVAAGNVLFLANTSSGTTTIATGGLLNLISGNGNLPICNYVLVNGGTIQNQSAPASDDVGLGWVGGQAGTLIINSGLANFAGVKVDFGHAIKGTLDLNGGVLVLSSSLDAENNGGFLNLNGGTLQLSATIGGNGNLVNTPSLMNTNVGNGGAIINLNGFSTTISNSLLNSGGTSTGGLTVYSTSTGTLTLTGSNTYTGPTQINSGVVAITGTGTLGNAAPLTMGGGRVDLGTTSQTVGAVNITAAAANGNTIQSGTLIGASYAASNTTGNALIAANLSGAAGLTVSGTGGQLTLNIPSTFSGTTNVTGGTLVLNSVGANTGALPYTSAVNVGPGSLSVPGTASIGSANLTLANNGNLNVSDGSATTLFTVNGNLNLNQGSSMTFELGATGGSCDFLAVDGLVSSSGTTAINVGLLTGQQLVFGQYELAATAAPGFNASNFTVGTRPAGFYSFTFATPSNTSLVLTVTGNATPATAYWTGKRQRRAER